MQSSSPDPGILASLGWIDLGAVAILVVFAVMGLMRGFVWQAGRIATLALAFLATGLWGDAVGARMASWFPAGTDARLPVYIAYVSLFVIVVVVVSLLTYLAEKLVAERGLTVADRVGGGVLGLGTGACVVLALLATVTMFLSSGRIVHAAERSRSMAVSRTALDFFGASVPRPLREAFGLMPGAALVPAPPAATGSVPAGESGDRGR